MARPALRQEWPPVDIHEQIAVWMAQERTEDAGCAPEQMRAIPAVRVGQSTRVRLGGLRRELAKASVRNVPSSEVAEVSTKTAFRN